MIEFDCVLWYNSIQKGRGIDMSLNIYRSISEVPEDIKDSVVINNDGYFDAMTELEATLLVSDILKQVDKGYLNSLISVGKLLSTLKKFNSPSYFPVDVINSFDIIVSNLRRLNLV